MSRNADRMKSSRKRALKTLVELDPETIDTLTRRARFKAEADTKPDSVGRSKGVVSDPTLSRVVAIMSGKNFTDPVFESVKRISTTFGHSRPFRSD